MTLSELAVDLKLNAEQFISGVESAMTTWESFGGGLMKVGTAMSAAVTLPLVGLGQAALKMGTQLQQAEIAFGTMLGSAELAGAYLEELKDFAAKTPFEFAELVPAAKRLMALGFAAEETIPMLKALGNAAAGLGGGVVLIQRLGLALGQMRAKAKVSAEEMRQLAEAGIPAWEMLAKAMGKTTGELMKLSEKGQVSAAAAIPLLIAGINEKFGGLMEGFMETAMGQYSNVKDQLGFVLADIGKALLPIAALLIEKFALPAVSALRDLAGWLNKLSESSKFLIIGFAAVAAAIGPMTVALGAFGYMYAPIIAGAARVAAVLIPAFTNIALSISGTSMVLTAFETSLLGFATAILPVLAAVGAAFILWQIPAFRKMIEDAWGLLKRFWSDTIQPFIGAVLDVGKAFLQAGAELVQSGLIVSLDTLRQAMNSTAVREFGDSLRSLAQAYKDLYGALGPILELLRPVVKLFGEWVAVSVGGQIQAGLWAIETGLSNAAKALQLFITMVSAQLTVALEIGKQGLDNIASTLNFMKPVVDAVVGAFQGLVKYLSEKFPFLVTLANLLGGAYDGLKNKITSFVDKAVSGNKAVAAATVTSLDQMTAAFQAAVKNQKELEKAATTVDEKTGKLGATYQQVAAAADAAQKAESALREEMKKQGVDLETLYAAWTKSKQVTGEARMAVEKLTQQQKEGKATNEQVAQAKEKVVLADKAMIAAQLLLQQSGVRLGIGLADLNKQYAKATVATKTLEDQQKGLKEALKTAELQLDIVARRFVAGTASAAEYADAQHKVAEAQKASDPSKWIEGSKKATTAFQKWAMEVKGGLGAILKPFKDATAAWPEFKKALIDGTAPIQNLNIMAKALGDNLRNLEVPDFNFRQLEDGTVVFFKKLGEGVLRLIDAEKLLGIQVRKTAKDYKDAYEEMLNAPTTAEGKPLYSSEEMAQADKEQLDARYKMYKAGGEALTALEFKRWAKYQEQNQAATVLTRVELEARVEAEKKALDEVMSDENATQGERLQRQRVFWEAQLALAQLSGGKQVDIAKDHLKKIEEALAKLAKTYKGFWQKVADDMRQALSGMFSNIAQGMSASILGIDRRQFNKDLESQANDLRGSLAERTQEWADYQAGVATRQTEAQQKYEDTLAEEGAALRASLDERVKEYEDAEAETAQKLDEVRAEYAKNLASELADLASSLEEQRVEYEDYVADINTQLAETRQEHADQLADQLSDLDESLDDQRRSYDLYVADVNQKLGRIGEDYAEQLDDENKQVKGNIAEKQKDYKRDEEDILEKLIRLKKAGKTENDEEVKDLRKSLSRKKEDLDQYIQEQTAALAEFGDDAKRQYDREVSDLAESLNERTAEWTRYQQENASKRSQNIADNAADLAKDEAALAKSLADRTADWIKYQADNQTKVAEAYTKYTDGLAKEEADLIESLVKKQKALDDYIVEVNKKWEKIQAAALATLNKEEADLAASLVARNAEYDKYIADTQTKLDDILARHRTLFGDIAEAWKQSLIGMAGNVISIFIKEGLEVMKEWIWDFIKDGGTLGKLGKAISDVFSGLAKTIIGLFSDVGKTVANTIPSIPGISPPGYTPPVAPPYGGAAGAGGAAASSVSGVMGTIGAVSAAVGAVSSIVSNFQQYAMNKTLDEMGRTMIKVEHYSLFALTTQLAYLPKLEDIWWYLWNAQFVALQSIDASAGGVNTLLARVEKELHEEFLPLLAKIAFVLEERFRDGVVSAVTGTSAASITTASSTTAASTITAARDIAAEIIAAQDQLSLLNAQTTTSAIVDAMDRLLATMLLEGATSDNAAELSKLVRLAKEDGKLSAEQIQTLDRVLAAVLLGDTDWAEKFSQTIRELRESGISTVESLANSIKDLGDTITSLTAELSRLQSTTTTTPPVDPTSTKVVSLLDMIAAAAAAEKVPRPTFSAADQTSLAGALANALKNAQAGYDPHNPLGKEFLGYRDKLAAEIAALETAGKPVSETMRVELAARSADPVVTTQEAFVRNSGAAYQTWLQDIMGITRGKLAQWDAYNAAQKAIADLGAAIAAITNMSNLASRYVPGWVNPLSGNVTPGQESTVPIVVKELTVRTVIDGREVGNAMIQNLALQGVRM